MTHSLTGVSKKYLHVVVQLTNAAQPLEYDDVRNVYEKGSFLCISRIDGNVVEKFPISSIFRVIHDYGYSASSE